jgi:hypothetical protein
MIKTLLLSERTLVLGTGVLSVLRDSFPFFVKIMREKFLPYQSQITARAKRVGVAESCVAQRFKPS